MHLTLRKQTGVTRQPSRDSNKSLTMNIFKCRVELFSTSKEIRNTYWKLHICHSQLFKLQCRGYLYSLVLKTSSSNLFPFTYEYNASYMLCIAVTCLVVTQTSLDMDEARDIHGEKEKNFIASNMWINSIVIRQTLKPVRQNEEANRVHEAIFMQDMSSFLNVSEIRNI